MALATYSDLKTSVLAYLVRDADSDALAKVADWITLAEDYLRLNFSRIRSRYGETKNAAFSINAEYVNLPTGFIRMRKIRIEGTPVVELDYISPEAADRQYTLTSVNQKPRYYTIIGSQIRFVPVPDSTYTATIIYSSLPALSVSATTNWLLTNHPKVYHTAVLAEAHNYYKDYEDAAAKRAELDSLLEAMSATDDGDKQGGNMRVRVALTP